MYRLRGHRSLLCYFFSPRPSPKRSTIHSSNSDQPQTHDFQDAAFQWARKQPQLARQVLQVPDADMSDLETPPPFLMQQQLSTNFSLVDYLEWRNWTLPQKDDDDEASTCAFRLVSHTLSAPLTLAKSLLIGRLNGKETTNRGRSWRCCCVGARAEATLPPWYWKEVLVLLHHSVGHDANSPAGWNIRIDFVGPDVNARSKDLALSYRSSNLTLSWSLGGGRLFHQLDDDMVQWDAFVFFNPGFGHPNLKAGWLPTLEKLLHSEKLVESMQLLLLTAHSPLDVQRDFQVLQNYSPVRGIRANDYSLNPFASRIAYADPLLKGHLVQPNLYAYHYMRKKGV